MHVFNYNIKGNIYLNYSFHIFLQGGDMRKLVYSTSLSLDGYIDSAVGQPSTVKRPWALGVSCSPQPWLPPA
jgi:hypothetical protein